MISGALQVAVLALLGLRLVLADQRASSWMMGPVPAVLVAVAVAIAVVTEPKVWRRWLMIAMVACGHAVWMLHDDHWRDEWFWQKYAVATVAVAVAMVPFLSRRAWQWSLAPVPVLVLALLWMLLPGYAADVTYRQATWLAQVVCLLVANSAWRAHTADPSG
jgi:hypothetical protein